jgi:hypothetical protein
MASRGMLRRVDPLKTSLQQPSGSRQVARHATFGFCIEQLLLLDSPLNAID